MNSKQMGKYEEVFRSIYGDRVTIIEVETEDDYAVTLKVKGTGTMLGRAVVPVAHEEDYVPIKELAYEEAFRVMASYAMKYLFHKRNT